MDQANQKLTKENTSKAKLSHWDAFLTFVSATLLPLAAYAHAKHGTYNFFATPEQNKSSRKELAAKKAKKFFDQVLGKDKERADDFITLKNSTPKRSS